MLIRSTPTKPYTSYNIEVSTDLFSLVSLLMDQKVNFEHERTVINHYVYMMICIITKEASVFSCTAKVTLHQMLDTVCIKTEMTRLTQWVYIGQDLNISL